MKLADVYPSRGIEIVRGEGIFVFDSNGKKYLDCMQGHGVGILGHKPKHWNDTIQQQINDIVVCMSTLENPTRNRLVQKLGEILPKQLDSIFLCNSGTEAVEAAIKLARKRTGKSKIIAMKKGFHGRTLGSLSLTWKPKYRDGFGPLFETVHVRFNDLEDLQNKLDEEVAAVILEPVQGEGGLTVADKTYLQQVRQICDEKDVILIFDEVQTFLRTGKYFAFEHFDISPDILCISKSLGNGLPIGAMIAPQSLTDYFGMLGHGSTFGGNPLACASALATLEIIENEDLINNSKEIAQYLQDKIEKELGNYEIFRGVKGLNLMIGIDLRKKVGPYVKRASELGFLALPSGATTLRLLPPINLTKEQADEIVYKLKELFEDVQNTPN